MRGKRVAILESRLGQQMVDLVAKQGGVPLHAPALAEVPDVDPAYVARLVHDLETRPAKLAIFQTGVGTRALFAATDALGLTDTLLTLLAATVVAVRGPKPTAALRSRDVRIDMSARDPFTTHEVLEALQATADCGRARDRAALRRHQRRAGRRAEGARRGGGRDTHLPLGSCRRIRGR